MNMARDLPFIDVIFTHTSGQNRMTLDVLYCPNILTGKREFERQLLMFWDMANTLRGVTETQKPTPELVKISTCLYNMDLPLWYGEWDGKFYYENDIEQ